MNDLERKNILVDFPTVSVRPALITFVKDAIGEAKTLPLPERIVDGSRGHDIAGSLDGTPSQEDKWEKLFQLADRLD